MAKYPFTLTYGANGELTYPLAEVNTVTYKCSNESYITNPQIRMVYRYTDTGGSPQYGFVAELADSITRTSLNEDYGGRAAFALDTLTSSGKLICFDTPLLNSDWGRYHVNYGNSLDNPDAPMPNEISGSNFPNTGSSYLIPWNNYRVTSVYTWNLSTNIPVFETSAEAAAYITSGAESDLKKAVNYDYEVIEEGEEFLVNNVYTSGTWSAYGLTNQGAIGYRLLKGKLLTGAKLSFYKIAGISDGALKYGISTSGTLTALQYSNDGVTWHDSATMPYSFFYREHEDEAGTFSFGLSFYSQIPVFEDQETADKYVDDDPSVSIKDAVNWPQISGQYPITNTTGSNLPASVFGDVKLKGFFSQQYICDSTCLSAIANDLFNTAQGGIWESMKQGLDMYGASAIDAVMGLSYWPFSVSDFIGAGNYAAAQYIWFGGYGWNTTGHGTCNQIIYASGYKDIGTLRVMPTFNSWRDYEPYTKLYVSIPYCGTYQLDIARYIGKDIKFRYFIDTRTNGCICALIADGYLMDYFNGQMGVTMPITLTDYAAYMNSQMQVLLQGGGQAASSFGSAVGTVGQVAPLGTAGLLAGGAVAAGGAALSGAAIGAKTVYGLSQNNINNFNKTKGGSSSMINCYLPQTIDLIFEIQESCEPSNYNEMFGVPSMAQGIVGNFTGFLKCQSVKVNAGKATEREKERIKQMLLSGIYI